MLRREEGQDLGGTGEAFGGVQGRLELREDSKASKDMTIRTETKAGGSMFNSLVGQKT